MGETRLEDSQQLKDFAEDLRTLGYRSVEQFLGAAASAPDALSNYLNIERKDLQAVADNFPRPAQSLTGSARQKRFSLGVRLDKIRPAAVSLMRAPGRAAALPPKIDMSNEMQPIKDQGNRSTCVAHASGAVAEHYLREKGRKIDLSRQYLYWACKQHDGIPTEEGTWVAVAMIRLVEEGCCSESKWPYEMTTIEGNESQGPPPPEAKGDAPMYKVPRYRQIAPTSVIDIKAALAQKHCVAFSIPVFDSWYQNDEVIRTGEILNPLPGEHTEDGHAMCFVGYEDLPNEIALGGGRFLLRNSWGARWGKESALGAGYGTIPYSYVNANCSEAFTIPT